MSSPNNNSRKLLLSQREEDELTSEKLELESREWPSGARERGVKLA